ncbi:hypothetical protein SAMN02746066_03408 [Anaerosporobacter mobilis DSM 15930]|jgi:phage tail sheath protein FI|uniref:Phage tail sheath family protein n=1 Tax=Anaerosporobacter mobilis DSM 15930 TaxID=1120996 RepID=A0A1M7LU03_9FIRM|nr:phage tail protein [Anaerosporobacter mobilis]SHM81802.1 hypothetical protein SAMN02746066_03408 [Anaerosporobacter mobilis DSM 15930]
MYQHGVRTKENPTSLSAPIVSKNGPQIVFGTAPINLIVDPSSAVNKLVIANTMEEAKGQLGYSDDFDNYTLCQSMKATFEVFKVAPIIFCNVLDPAIHKKANEEKSVQVSNNQATYDVKGVLLSTVVVKKDSTALTVNIDYILEFDDNGYVVITLVAGGAGESATTLKVTSDSIDPSKVTTTDIIGGYDSETGVETGLELVRQVYPKFNLPPGLIIAPGWSKNKTVAAAMVAKCTEINGVFNTECIIDFDTTTVKKYTQLETAKETLGVVSSHAILTWPMLKIDDVKYSFSALLAALIYYTDANNSDVPNLSPSNKLLGVSATVLNDGTEVMLDQVQANEINALGIVTALNFGGWKSWGNNTACYPDIKDPKDRWICCRRFFSWWGNNFIIDFANKVDELTNFRLIESIVDAENIKGNSYTAQNMCAGAKIQYLTTDNPIENILDGKVVFRQYLAPYTPAEDILNILEFDPSMIESALGGE